MDAKTAIEEQIKRWRDECAVIDAERQALLNADAVLGGDLLKPSIALWDMRMVRLQRCVIDLQGVVAELNRDAIRELERANVELTGSRAGSSPVSPESEANGVERRVGPRETTP